MKLIVLGSGSAFTVGSDNFQSNFLMQSDSGENLLIDCGTDIRFSLHKMNLSYGNITDVYISHLHADHAGGLEWLGFTTKFDEHCAKPRLHISESLVDDLWNKVLAGGMGSLQGRVAHLSDYFDVRPITKNAGFDWQDCHFQLIQSIHIMNGFTVVPSYGLFFGVNGLSVYITADTQFCPNLLLEFYHKADIIFHDCETSTEYSRVHSHYSELLTLDPEIRSKMWLYHYNPGERPDAHQDGFRGFATRGQIFDFAKTGSLF